MCRALPVVRLCVAHRTSALSVLLCVSSAILVFSVVAFGGVDYDWQAAPGYRWKNLQVARDGKTGFTLLSPEATGIFFTNLLSDAAAARNRVLEPVMPAADQ
jgi:hypothetical protein